MGTELDLDALEDLEESFKKVSQELKSVRK